MANLPSKAAPSGGAWGDASPQTPAKKTVWRMMEKVLVSAVADATDVTARRGAWRSHGRTQRMEGSGNRRLSPMSKRCGSRDECMAGVWGEASPQAPPEARWTGGPAARVRGAS